MDQMMTYGPDKRWRCCTYSSFKEDLKDFTSRTKDSPNRTEMDQMYIFTLWRFFKEWRLKRVHFKDWVQTHQTGRRWTKDSPNRTEMDQMMTVYIFARVGVAWFCRGRHTAYQRSRDRAANVITDTETDTVWGGYMIEHLMMTNYIDKTAILNSAA